MFNFKKKCPICKMKLEDGKEHIEGFGKKFCSEKCKEEYRVMLQKEKAKTGGGCCH